MNVKVAPLERSDQVVTGEASNEVRRDHTARLSIERLDHRRQCEPIDLANTTL
jgi:hypothetical protein